MLFVLTAEGQSKAYCDLNQNKAEAVSEGHTAESLHGTQDCFCQTPSGAYSSSRTANRPPCCESAGCELCRVPHLKHAPALVN